MKYRVIGIGDGADVEIEADSPSQAAQEWADTGSWEFAEGDRSVRYTCRVAPLGDDGEPDEEAEAWIDVVIDPPEPECASPDGHAWGQSLALFGGLKENPGVQAHSGGVIIREYCPYCAWGRETDTWDQSCGGTPFESVRYFRLDSDDPALCLAHSREIQRILGEEA